MYTYLASPYSGTEQEQEERYDEVLFVTSVLLSRGIAVYSPIVHCHPMSLAYDMPGDATFWKWFDEIMITQANCFAVLTLTKWELSKGIWAEYNYAKGLGKPIVFYALKEGAKLEQIEDSRVSKLVEILHGVHEA